MLLPPSSGDKAREVVTAARAAGCVLAARHSMLGSALHCAPARSLDHVSVPHEASALRPSRSFPFAARAPLIKLRSHLPSPSAPLPLPFFPSPPLSDPCGLSSLLLSRANSAILDDDLASSLLAKTREEGAEGRAKAFLGGKSVGLEFQGAGAEGALKALAESFGGVFLPGADGCVEYRFLGIDG